MSLDFLNKFKKDVKTMGVNTELREPTFWIDSGNYIINRVLSGSYKKAFPQGKLSALAGPSAAGKTYLATNTAKYALDEKIGVLYIDTENAVDKGHFDNMGVDIDNPLLQYVDCTTLSQCISIVSSFIKNYKESKETHPFIIIIDSLDMLSTDGDAEKYEKKGEIGGDQGQWAKQAKKMLQMFVQDLKNVNIHMICTKQVYANQDPIDKLQNPWKFTDALKFAFSQILVVTKLLLKNKETHEFNGIRLQVFGFKTRLTKPFQKCSIEVPYDSGMDRYTGTLEAAIDLGIVNKNGAWNEFNGRKFYEKEWKSDDVLKDQIFQELLKQEDKDLFVQDESEIVDETEFESPELTVKKRQERVALKS